MVCASISCHLDSLHKETPCVESFLDSWTILKESMSTYIQLKKKVIGQYFVVSISHNCFLGGATPCVIQGKESMPLGQVQLCKDDIGSIMKPMFLQNNTFHCTSTLLIGDACPIMAMCKKRSNMHAKTCGIHHRCWLWSRKQTLNH